MAQISDNVFEMISDPAGINLTLGENPRFFNEVIFQDSILNFFPWGDIHLLDKPGIILTAYTFIEGMKFATRFGRPEETLNSGTVIGGYLTHDYAWSEDQVNATVRDSDYLSGINCFRVISNYFFKDHISTTAYQGQISNVVQTIINDVYGISDASKIFIDTTTNDVKNIWYQTGRYSREFLKDTLSRNAFSSSIQGGERVPFCTFINCDGEFYFKSFASLYAQTPVATYEAKLAMDKVADPLAIQEITWATGGAPTNKDFYRMAAWSLDESGEVQNEVISFADKYYKLNSASSTNAGSNAGNNVGKYPINNANARQTNSNLNFGLFETGDEDLLRARQTHQYYNSNIAFRIDIVILQNAKVKTGKMINIKIKKFSENDDYSSELSGNFLVMSSQYHMDINNVIYAHHTLCRPSIPFDNQYKYTANIIS